jgi:hypothetical protein
LKDYGEIPGGKSELQALYFIHSTDPIHLNFGQNTDGFEILAAISFTIPQQKK